MISFGCLKFGIVQGFLNGQSELTYRKSTENKKATERVAFYI